MFVAGWFKTKAKEKMPERVFFFLQIWLQCSGCAGQATAQSMDDI